MTSANMNKGRYHLPSTPYFEGLRRGMPLKEVSGYARAERRGADLGHILERRLVVPLRGAEDYSPYGAATVERARMLMNTDNATGRWHRAVVASPGTAILGLGEAPRRDDLILAGAGGPIMIGKSAYFGWTAGVNAEPLTIETRFRPDQKRHVDSLTGRAREEQMRIYRAENFADIVLSVANNYGFINVEDAQGKDLPLIFGRLEEEGVGSSIWSDDRQGTGVITAAGMLSWADQTGRWKSDEKPLEGIRVVLFGAGAGARGVYDELVNNGVRHEDVLVVDSKGVLDESREDVQNDPFKGAMVQGIKAGIKIEDFAKGADAIINLGVKESLTADLNFTERLVRGLAKNAIFLPMTNPDPGITPAQLYAVRPDVYYGSGNQVFENPFNNFTAFGYIGLAALLARTSHINGPMTVAAARGIHAVAKMGPATSDKSNHSYGKFWLVPRPDDTRLIAHEAGAAARAALYSGISGLLSTEADEQIKAVIEQMIADAVTSRQQQVEAMRREVVENGPHFWMAKHPDRYAPFSINDREGYDVAPQIDFAEFADLAKRFGLRDDVWQRLVVADPKATDGHRLDEKALTVVLKELQEIIVGNKVAAKFNNAIDNRLLTGREDFNETVMNLRLTHTEIAERELAVIFHIAMIYPELGLVLALRRGRARPENWGGKPTLFHREAIKQGVINRVPEAQGAIDDLLRFADVELAKLS